jgi:hypothetical protein
MRAKLHVQHDLSPNRNEMAAKSVYYGKTRADLAIRLAKHYNTLGWFVGIGVQFIVLKYYLSYLYVFNFLQYCFTIKYVNKKTNFEKRKWKMNYQANKWMFSVVYA